MGKTREAYGIRGKFLRMCQELYANVSARVRVGQTLSDAFSIKVRTTTGLCTLSLFVFSFHYGQSRGVRTQGIRGASEG